jgi:RNA polymerase sigma-70 factor (ECF subfamily)
MKPITEPETSEQTLHPEFEKLYKEYFPMTCAAAYNVLGSRELAEDVAQDVFTALAESRFSPDMTQNLKGYLYSAATKQAISVIRWQGRRKSTDADVERMEEAAFSPQDGPFSGPLQNAIDKLKPEWANMLLLRYERDCSEAEVAKICGRSRTWVSVTLTRARRRLGKLMEKEMGGKQ